MTISPVTPSALWKRMTTEQRRRAAAALYANTEAKSEQQQAVQLIAKHLKFRPKTVNGLDADKKARYLATVPEIPEEMTARLLVVYHLAEQRPMMGAFLDAAGIRNEDGMIEEEAIAPDPATVREAAARIARTYPAADVALYLATLFWQDPGAWATLADVPELSALPT
jgi:hypothetical protein